ncbi:hypothetical protein NESM_000304800 [Novymonas esmeraldas]|uniref:Uncharacterized protein n=1 Tax=Novymonas esmeraldas TaxID=1808958 RepID=A0AAW0F921_9TRYP
MAPSEKGRLRRWLKSAAEAAVDYVRPEDANGPSSTPVDGGVWYATMFLYPNHWRPGQGGALPLPSSPYRSFPVRSMLWEMRDHFASLIILLLFYVVYRHYFPAAAVEDVAAPLR